MNDSDYSEDFSLRSNIQLPITHNIHSTESCINTIKTKITNYNPHQNKQNEFIMFGIHESKNYLGYRYVCLNIISCVLYQPKNDNDHIIIHNYQSTKSKLNLFLNYDKFLISNMEIPYIIQIFKNFFKNKKITFKKSPYDIQSELSSRVYHEFKKIQNIITKKIIIILCCLKHYFLDTYRRFGNWINIYDIANNIISISGMLNKIESIMCKSSKYVPTVWILSIFVSNNTDIPYDVARYVINNYFDPIEEYFFDNKFKLLNNKFDLNLKNKNVKSIKYLSLLSNLSKKLINSIDLSNNNITKISGDALIGYDNLESIYLGKNRINSMSWINAISHIKSLDVSKNNITRISAEFLNLVNVEYLNLSDNQISRLNNLNEMQNLKYLFLSKNKIRYIYGLTQLKSLICLDLSSNSIFKIENLKGLISLEYLNLNNNEIFLFENIQYLTSLKTLWIKNNMIQNQKLKKYTFKIIIDDL